MKLILLLLAGVLWTDFSSGAVLGSREIYCNLIMKTVIHELSTPHVTPIFQNGRIVLSESGLGYGPGEFQFGLFSAVIRVSIATEMAISMKIISNRSSPVVAKGTGFFRENDIGIYQGSLQLENNDIASLAERKKISYDEASVSEELPIGENFVGAWVFCF